MNIAIDGRSLMSYPRTGVGTYTYELLRALLEQPDSTHTYYIFFNAFKPLSDQIPLFVGDRVHIVYTRWPNKLFHLLVWLRIIAIDRLIEKKMKVRLDYFFCPNIHITHIAKTPVLLTIHDISFDIYKECYSWGRRIWHALVQPRAQATRAHMVITPSEHSRQDILFRYQLDPKNVQVIVPGLAITAAIKTEQQRTAVLDRLSIHQPYFFFLGTIEPRKNIEILVRSFIKTNLVSKGYRLVLAGSLGWKEKNILHLIRTTPGVTWIGYVSEEEKNVLLQQASVFVYPSLYEGFGFPVLEARAAGIPVITSNRSSLPDVAGEHALLIHPDSSDDLACAMIDACSRTVPLTDREVVQKQYSWTTAATQLSSFFNSTYANWH